MAQFIINLDSISTDSAKSDIMTYLESKPDYAKWQDFYESSEGTTLIELISGLSAFIAGNVVMSRREAYLPYAKNRSSNIGIAATLGYSVYRGRNARITVSITPTETDILQKYSIVGTVGDANLILLEETVLSNGTPTTLNCTLGEIKTESITIASEDMQTFRFYNPNVSEDLRIFLNSIEVEYTNAIRDLAMDKYVVISNAFGAFDLFYLNNIEPKYGTGDVLMASYIETNDLTFTLQDIEVDYEGVTSIEIADVYSSEEAISAIKVNAPLYNETQGLIKGREDYPKFMLSLDTDFVDTAGHDFSPAIVDVTYLKSNLDLLNDLEKSDISEQLLTARPFGVAPARIVDPVNATITLNIIVKLLTTTTESITDMIEGVVSSYEKILGKTIDTDLMENSIEQASYIKTARVSLDAPVWEADNLYSRCKIVSSTLTSDLVFEMSGDIRLSGAVKPTFNDIVDEIIEDNEIFWKCIIDDRCYFSDWSASTNYEMGDIIAPDGITNKYVVFKRKNLSDSTEPAWTTNIGDYIYDNEVVWKCISLQGTPTEWLADEPYCIGDIVTSTTDNGLAYTVVRYQSLSDSSEPTWPSNAGETVIDNKILWLARSKEDNLLTLNWNEYSIIDQNVTIST